MRNGRGSDSRDLFEFWAISIGQCILLTVQDIQRHSCNETVIGNRTCGLSNGTIAESVCQISWQTYTISRSTLPSRGVSARRLGYCSPDTSTFSDLCNDADDELFNKATLWSNHVLHALLPPTSASSQRYNLRQRSHLLQLPEHMTQLSQSINQTFFSK